MEAGIILLRADLLQLHKPRQTILTLQLCLTLNQRQRIVDERLLQTVAGGVDPLARNLLLGVGDDVGSNSFILQTYLPFT